MIVLFLSVLSTSAFADPGIPPLLRSASGGDWSDPSSWEGGKVPGAGARVQIRGGHVVTFDATEDVPIRSIHVAGTLRFDPDRDARLTVGLIKIQGGDDADEAVAVRDMAHQGMGHHRGMPALEIGTIDRPITPGKTVLIRLKAADGLDPDDFPAIVSVGGRVEMHGSPLSRSWVKLGESAAAGASAIKLSEAVGGWKVEDRILITATSHPFAKELANTPTVRERSRTEERTIREIAGDRLKIDGPLAFDHSAEGGSRGEVANLGRNVVVESAEPAGIRGHTMFHRGTSGSISFAEFRHLGKRGVLGRYSLHFHRAGDSMRGFSIVGASIHESANRWITIHGSNSIIVRDCVGDRSEGHGFFLEDATESGNFFDRNLAIRAIGSRPLPGQHLPSDRNDGAGFWWASGGNAFTGNIAVECDGYGFRFDPPPGAAASPSPRFDRNEAHSQRRYGFKMGGADDDAAPGGARPIGPDGRHPLVLRDTRAWECRWAFSPGLSSMLVDGLDIDRSDFGFWRPVFDRFSDRRVSIRRTRWPYFASAGAVPDSAAFPAPLDPIDDRPPSTAITRVRLLPDGRTLVRGISVDGSAIRSVRVNGRSAIIPNPDAPDWEITLDSPAPRLVSAIAEDAIGNAETSPHEVEVGPVGGDPADDSRDAIDRGAIRGDTPGHNSHVASKRSRP